MSTNLARKLGAARTARVLPHPAPPAPQPVQRELVRQKPRTSPRHLVLGVSMATLLAVNAIGTGYYAASLPVRVRHPLHEWLRPSGFIGQLAGVLAFVIFVFLWLYPLRKRFRSLAWTGSVGRWLDVHVTAALTLPLLLAVHSAWRFEGMIGLGYTAILLVCASGIVGRYLYARIPRARSGVELTRDEVAAQRQSLIDRIAAATRIDRAVVESTLKAATPRIDNSGVWLALAELVAGDIMRWRRVRRLRSRWTSLAPAGLRPSRYSLDEALRLASREISLAHQVRVLDATQRAFRWWHVAHRPVALTALVAVALHVAVVVAVGATWLG